VKDAACFLGGKRKAGRARKQACLLTLEETAYSLCLSVSPVHRVISSLPIFSFSFGVRTLVGSFIIFPSLPVFCFVVQILGGGREEERQQSSHGEGIARGQGGGVEVDPQVLEWAWNSWMSSDAEKVLMCHVTYLYSNDRG